MLSCLYLKDDIFIMIVASFYDQCFVVEKFIIWVKKMKYPKVLIISHNALSLTNNMGKTLVSYFSSFPKECIAQLYLHEGMPNSNTCSNYYCFDDKDALYSIFNKSIKGKIYKGRFFDENSSSVCTGRLYSVGKKKKPFIWMKYGV